MIHARIHIRIMDGCAGVAPARGMGEAVGVGSNVDGSKEDSVCSLTNLKNVTCAVGSDPLGDEKIGDQSYLLPSKPKSNKTAAGTGGKPKRKSRSTRRRLNALTNNASLHFSDTDSEGELVLINPRADNVMTMAEAVGRRGDMPNPTISVTTDEIDGTLGNSEAVDIDKLKASTPNRSRRQSYAENLTDCDEIYSSDPEVPDDSPDGTTRNRKASLMITKDARYPAIYLRETDCEDFTNDEDDGDDDGSGKPIYVPMRNDIFADFNGETITTKEGNGPFSIEVRNQLSFDEGAAGPIDDEPANAMHLPSIVPTSTDSEDMDASDEENTTDGARREFDEIFQDLDVAGTSQIIVKNSNKTNETMHQLLSVSEAALDDGTTDGHTDVEDIDNE